MYIRLLVWVPPPSHLTSCTPTKPNLYFEISSATALSDYRIHTSNIPRNKSHIHFLSLISFIRRIRPGSRPFVTQRNKLFFSPTPNLQAGEPLHVGSPRLSIQYIHSYPPYLEEVSSILNLRTCHAVVTRDPPNKGDIHCT
jgi:hypothetical protein